MHTGKHLAHYEVGERIGKGGMGEVYRARDTKLGRDVALKILPPEFAADADRLARFEREARLLASLHHPNIASIFGFEATPDCTFLVMELVEGEDLAQMLKRGPVPVDDAVEIARQISEGLEEAHEKGIVHRDLKPANVKRSPDGKVKVLDFGLARAYAGQTAGEEFISSAPTMTAAMTQVGTVLGTAAYMSPEQARGKEVDRRADIWAFGVILFEMLTGRQTFVGETASDTLAGILKSEPEWDALPPNLPHQVERVLRRCLAKDPRQRLRDIGEARIRLENPDAESGLLSGSLAAVREARGGRGAWLNALPWLLVALSLAGCGWLLAGRGDREQETALHLAIPGPANASIHTTGSFPGLPEISPDGRMIAYSASDEGGIQLYLRALDKPQAVAVSDTRDAQYPFWSPDSRWVAYYVRTEGLMKVPVDGGPPQLVCKAGNGKGGSWNQFDELLLTLDYNTSIFAAPAGGGEARPVTDLEADKGFNSHRHPQFMPDGKHFIYFARGAGRIDSQIRWASLDGGAAKVVVTAASMGFYASGHLLYVSHGDLMAQPFDPSTGQLSGSPKPIVADVMVITGAQKAAFSASREGSLVYLHGQAQQVENLIWCDRAGRELEPVADPAEYTYLHLSPDGRFAVSCVTTGTGTWDLYTIELARDLRTRFTTDLADDGDPVWSRDSRKVYFTSDRDGLYAVYRKELGSPAAPQKVFSLPVSLRLWDVDADETTIAYSIEGEGTGNDLYVVDLAEGAEPRLLSGAKGNQVMAQWSPDGKWLGFASGESGEFQVYVAPYPAMAPVTQVSTSSAMWSAWTKDGAEMIYHETAGRLMAAPLAAEGGMMSVGQPEKLFDIIAPVTEARDWTVSQDGERFLMVNNVAAEQVAFCDLVLGWPRLLAK